MIIGRVSSHEALDDLLRPSQESADRVLRPHRTRQRRPSDSASRHDPTLTGLTIGVPLAAVFIATAVADRLILDDSPAPSEGDGTDGGPNPTLMPQDAGAPASVRSAAAAPLAPAEGGVGATESGASTAGAGDALDPAALSVPVEGAAVAPAEAGGGGFGASGSAATAAGTGDAATGDISVALGGNVFAPLTFDDPTTEPANLGEGLGPIGEYIVGGDGGVVIIGTDAADVIHGGAGDDVIHGMGGDDWIHGGAGNDQLFGGEGDDRLFGGEGDDVLHGGPGDDWLDGGPGDDQLFGGEGNDVLLGGAGDDLLDGGSGSNLMIGGSGNDTLVQNNIHDLAFGDDFGIRYDGENTLVVGTGFVDTLPAGVGSATLLMSENLPAAGDGAALPEGVAAYTQLVDGSIQHITLLGTADLDIVGDSRDNRIIGNDGDNVIHGVGGNNWISGGGGNNTIYGGAGDDVLEGGSGDDRLFGGAGDDRLYGGAGNDVLYGGAGSNLLYGGAGDDTYVIGLRDGSIDTIFDHEGSNVIKLKDVGNATVETVIVGDDLYIIANKNPLAIFSDYVGNESALAGIDLGDGLVSVESLMVGTGGAASASSGGPAANDDLLADHLGTPTVQGTAASDHLIAGDDGDWLVGYEGDDHLQGGAGDDVLDGGAGNNLLEGGAGNDLYLFRAGDNGFATIRDSEGVNHAELQGFNNPDVRGVVIGNDLWVVVDFSPLFVVEGHANHPEAFAGVKVGDDFIATEDLFT